MVGVGVVGVIEVATAALGDLVVAVVALVVTAVEAVTPTLTPLVIAPVGVTAFLVSLPWSLTNGFGVNDYC